MLITLETLSPSPRGSPPCKDASTSAPEWPLMEGDRRSSGDNGELWEFWPLELKGCSMGVVVLPRPLASWARWRACGSPSPSNGPWTAGPQLPGSQRRRCRRCAGSPAAAGEGAVAAEPAVHEARHLGAGPVPCRTQTALVRPLVPVQQPTLLFPPFSASFAFRMLGGGKSLLLYARGEQVGVLRVRV